MACRAARTMLRTSLFSTCTKITASKTQGLGTSVNLHLVCQLPGSALAKSARTLASLAVPSLLQVHRKQSLLEAAALCIPVISKTAALSLAINDTEVTKTDEGEDEDEATIYTLSGMEVINWVPLTIVE